jgi:hypothetical protein
MSDLHTFTLSDLISHDHDTALRWVASTNGGEYAGPCSFCGECGRLHVQPETGATNSTRRNRGSITQCLS